MSTRPLFFFTSDLSWGGVFVIISGVMKKTPAKLKKEKGVWFVRSVGTWAARSALHCERVSALW